jgi:hypothetical protein
MMTSRTGEVRCVEGTHRAINRALTEHPVTDIDDCALAGGNTQEGLRNANNQFATLNPGQGIYRISVGSDLNLASELGAAKTTLVTALFGKTGGHRVSTGKAHHRANQFRDSECFFGSDNDLIGLGPDF